MSRPASPGLEDVFAHVDANREGFVERLAGWVRTPSVSATGQGMPGAAGHARELVAAAGLEAEVAATPGWPLVLGHRPGPGLTTCSPMSTPTGRRSWSGWPGGSGPRA